MRTFASVFALVLLLSVSEGAVLLRFINTVPTRQNVNSYETGAITAGMFRLTGSPNVKIDRVALGYVASGATAPTYLWTEAISSDVQSATATDESGADAFTANLAWEMAMPPLRAYHGTGATDATDSVAPAGTTATFEITEVNIDQTILKSDGVGLYLSLAAGTYTFNAYAVLAGTDAASTYKATPSIFPTTKDSVFTFEDGKVYTLVAVGDGKYSTTPLPLTGTDVALKLFEENTTPATFGKASVRFFHAVKSAKTDTINVYLGSDATSPLVSGIAFGGLSSYVDVNPNAGQLFPITASSNPSSFIAPSSLDKKEVSLELRAGTRATIICAMDNEVAQKVFCRIIPSRVAAYVRLVNDLAASTFLHLGPVTGQPLNKVTLTLWAASEVPRPDQLAELSQAGSTRTITNHALNIRGLYKVVTNVAAGKASGYGEVFVPLPIMDFAVRTSVAIDVSTVLTDVGGYGTANTAAGPTNWFLGGIIAKRVHFAVRTNGGATLASSSNLVSKLPKDEAAGWIANSVLVDRFVDAGSYNTIFVYPKKLSAATNAGLAVQNPVVFAWRTDRTSAQVTSGIPSGSAYVSLVPFAFEGEATPGTPTADEKAANQNFVSGTLYIRQGSSSPLSKAYVAADEPAVILTTAVPVVGDLAAKVPHFTIPAGDYTYDFTPKATSPDPCVNALPGTNSLKVAAGQAYDLFVFNTRGCASARRADANQLSVQSVQQQSASNTGNADGTVLVSSGVTPSTSTTSTFYFAAASSNTMSISFIVAALFAIIAALL